MKTRALGGRARRAVPQFILWTISKGSRLREARTRLLTYGDGVFELGVYELRTDGRMDLQWLIRWLTASQVNEFARRAQREYEDEGWVMACGRCNGAGWVCEAHRDSVLGHRLVESSRHCDGAAMPCACEIGRQLRAKFDETHLRS